MEQGWMLLTEVRPGRRGGFGESDYATADRLDAALKRTGLSSDELRFRYILGPGYPLMRIETCCNKIMDAWKSLDRD